MIAELKTQIDYYDYEGQGFEDGDEEDSDGLDVKEKKDSDSEE